MKVRIISAICLVAILIGSLMIDYKVLGVVMLLCAMISYRELFSIKYGDDKKSLEVVRFLGYLSLIGITLNNIYFEIDEQLLLLIPMLGLTIPIVIYNDEERYNINDALFIMGIVFFLGFAYNNIIYMAKLDVSKCIFLFLIAFVTDTYSYIGGCLIGKHKLTSISPNKTIEGSIVGSIMGCAVGSVYYNMMVSGLNIRLIVIMCLFLIFLAEIGDLVFSSIKRYYNKKDYSNIIPGHGGMLDRFDSVIFVSLGFCIVLALM